MQIKSFRKATGLILLLSCFAVFPQNAFGEKIELECSVFNLYWKSVQPSTKPSISKYVFDSTTEKLIENIEIYTDENGIVRGKANTFKTELASPSLIIATYRESNGNLKRVRIDRTNMEIQEVYYFSPDIKHAQPVYSKGVCSMKKALDPKF